MLLKKTVVLVGMMGAGKTAVGRSLAQSLNVPFLDSDEEIVAASNMTIKEIFDKYGEDFFRSAETKVIHRLLTVEPGVLSTGGGAFLQEENRKNIKEYGVSVCISASVDLLWSRVKNKDTRPLLRTSNPRATLEEIYAKRAPIYAQSDLVVESLPDNSIAKTRDSILKALTTRPDVLTQKA